MPYHAFNLSGEEQKKFFWRSFHQERLRFTNSVARKVYVAFTAQLKTVAEEVAKASSQSDMETLARQQVQRTEKAIVQMYEDIYSSVGLYFAETTFDSMRKSGPETKADRTMLNNWARRVIAFVNEKAKRRIKGLQRTTEERVVKVIDQGIEDGLGIDAIARNLRNDSGLIEIYKNRSVVVARTEVISASNYGSQLGAKSTGLELEKEWISTRDGRTRGSEPDDEFDHLKADGQTKKMDDQYVIEGDALQFPGDPQGEPGNVINCRCTEAYKTT
ncbi:MAG TPA: phage minor head protein [Bacteroidota bacterium]